jgi:hypothetical protein
MAVTLNAAGDRAVAEIAVTDAAEATAPIEASALWTRVLEFTASGPQLISGIAQNKKVWPRTRSEPVTTDTPRLPSTWKTGNPLVTLSAPAPTNLRITGLTNLEAYIAWDNLGDYASRYSVYIALAALDWTDTPKVIAKLLPASTMFRVHDTRGGASYRVDVYYVDPHGGESQRASLAWQASLTHNDAHTDTAHTDTGHGDTHTDTHSDTHTDAHTDAPHGDSHGDASSHSDFHDDVGQIDTDHQDTHFDHGDGVHDDTHTDTSHTDSHADDGHVDAGGPHTDNHTDHTDAHDDTSHTDTHSDTHTDSHSDSAHVDGAHDDTHSDHSDGATSAGAAPDIRAILPLQGEL